MLKAHRRKRLRSAPFSSDWRRIIEAHCPFYQFLPEADRRELEGHVQVFMAEKKFEGCGGLTLVEKMKVVIAAYACLLLLHRDTDYFPGLKTVLVYPSTYVARTTRHLGSGVYHEGPEARAGEFWPHGSVVLAWNAVLKGIRDPGCGYNVIFHEFAHQLDGEDGHVDGAPLLAQHEPLFSRQKHRYADWSRIMKSEFEQLRARVEQGQSSVLRDYGATSPAEFFAVATECFFTKSQEMARQLPELYGQMKKYYQQDPAALGWDWPECSEP